MVLDSISKRLFLHAIENPPAKNKTSSVTLNLINTTGLIDLTKFGPSTQTEYILYIERPTRLGFSRSTEGILDRDLHNLVLAMNLNMPSACIRLTSVEFTQNEVTVRPPPDRPAVVRREGNMFTVTAEATVLVTDSASVHWGMSENIDEFNTIYTFCKLQSLRRFDYDTSSSVTTVNLAKALKEFEDAMNDDETLAIFKHLYNALELAANFDGSNDKDHALDAKINTLTGENVANLEKWRGWYNRTKHVDANANDIQKLLQGRVNLPRENGIVRKCANAALLARLP